MSGRFMSNGWLVLAISLLLALSGGLFGCNSDDKISGDGDGKDVITDDDDDTTNAECKKPCKSNLDCDFGESCECPPGSPNCRINEMCCIGPGDDDDDGNGGPKECMSELECPPGCDCVEMPGMEEGKKYCDCGGSVEDDDDDSGGGNEGDCNERLGKIPLIKVMPKELSWVNPVIGVPAKQSLVITNEGSCGLVVRSVEFENATGSDFSCEGCSPDKEKYPYVLEPGNAMNVSIIVTATKSEKQGGAVLIASNDDAYPIVRIPLSTEFKGISKMAVDPEKSLDFGMVNKGESQTKYITVSNIGTGSAPLKVINIYTDKSRSDFSVQVDKTFPVVLSPGDTLSADITFAPQKNDVYVEELVIEAQVDDATGMEDGKFWILEMSGRSVTSPRITVKPTSIDFGEVPADQEMTEYIELCNKGGENLEVGISWDQLSDPYFQNLNPTKVGLIPEQACFSLAVTYKPEDNQGNHKAILKFTSNDTNSPAVEVDMYGEATNPHYSEALKVEMKYDNNAAGWQTGDLRTVSLSYFSEKYGPCDEIDPSPNWYEEGRPRWSKLGGNSNPQFAFHAAGIDDENINVGLFDVYASYIEDCASIPIDILSQILNIGPDLLIWYLSSGVIPPGMINIDLGNMCFSRKASNVNVTAYINGKASSAAAVQLKKKGNNHMFFLIQRKEGRFILMNP